MITKEETIEIGILRKPHGTRGEIQCQLINDIFGIAEPEFVILEIDHILVPFYINEYRYKNDEIVLLTFEKIATEENVSHLVGCRVYLHKNQLPEDADITLANTSLIGFQVVDTEHSKIGTIINIDTSTLNPLFQLDNGVIFPAHDDFVVEIDTEKKILTVSLPDGMLTL